MTLQQLRYIVMVAETGNISEAADKLYISQPSLTTAIQNIEKELNTVIFNRFNRGVAVTREGEEVLGYARQILEQVEMMQDKFAEESKRNARFSVSCQHYSFAVNAFVDMIKQFDTPKYDFTLRETQTHEIIEDVSLGKSEVGVLYLSDKNEEIMEKLFRRHELQFTELFVAKPHIFISRNHPLAEKTCVTLEELKPYPYLSFEQGEHNSFYFSEEVLSTLDSNRNIKVRDRATLFNLAIGLHGYTVSSGVIDSKLNGENIIARPLAVEEQMRIGVITKKNIKLTRYAEFYLDTLKKYARHCG